MLYLAGGFPKSFFSAEGYETLQPGYPLGFTMLILGVYSISAYCGEWLVQLIPCFCTALCLYLFALQIVQSKESKWTKITLLGWVVALFLTEQTITISSFFYTESFLLLFLLVGLKVLPMNPQLGWILVGACGWVKLEGCILFILLWTVVRLTKGSGSAKVLHLIMGSLLPLFWLIYSRSQGGQVYDYASWSEMNLSKAWMATQEIFRYMVITPQHFGFVFIASFVTLLLTWCSRQSVLVFQRNASRLSSFFLVLYCICLIVIFSRSLATDFQWHLESLNRLLWIPAHLQLFFWVGWQLVDDRLGRHETAN